MRVPVGRYLPLTRRPNGIPSTVTGAQYQRPLCARTYNDEVRSTYNIQYISSFFFLSFFFPFFSLSSSAKFIRLFVIWVSRPFKNTFHHVRQENALYGERERADFDVSSILGYFL